MKLSSKQDLAVSKASLSGPGNGLTNGSVRQIRAPDSGPGFGPRIRDRIRVPDSGPGFRSRVLVPGSGPGGLPAVRQITFLLPDLFRASSQNGNALPQALALQQVSNIIGATHMSISRQFSISKSTWLSSKNSNPSKCCQHASKSWQATKRVRSDIVHFGPSCNANRPYHFMIKSPFFGHFVMFTIHIIS